MLIKELLSLTEAAEKTLELYKNPGAKVTHHMWPSGVTYRGHNVFKTVYEGSGADILVRAIDSFQKTSGSRSEDSLDSVQECYLGYSPKKDLFIMGYDGWGTIPPPPEDDEDEDVTEDFNCSPYTTFKITEDGKVKVEDTEMDMSGSSEMWYSKHGGLKAAHQEYPDLIDIRLD